VNSLKRPKFRTGTSTLEAAFEVLDSAGVKFNFNPQIARGFDYYTGFVFEVFDTDPTNNRAMFGGGRYDGLVAKFGVDPVPVVGFGMGDAVQWEMLDANNLWPALPPATEAMLIPLNLSSVGKANMFAAELRKQGQNIAIDFDVQRKLEKRIKAAQKLRIPKIGIIGDNENSFKDIKFKELNNGYR
jgi:histidyl-tRNA synthetase